MLGGALALAYGVASAGAARAEVVLSDPASPVTYRFAVAAGEGVTVFNDSTVTGDLHANGDVEVKKNAAVAGDVSAAGSVDVKGTVEGTVTEGAPLLTLPALLDEEALRALASRVFESGITLEDERVDDVVFVAGDVKVRGALNGVGTVIVTGSIDLLPVPGGGKEPPPPPVLDPETRLSLIALGTIRFHRDRRLRGVLHAGGGIDLQQGSALEGVLIAGGEVKLQNGAAVTFRDPDEVPPEVAFTAPPAGAFLATATPTVEAAWNDDLAGVDPTTAALRVDGADRTAEATIAEDGLTWSPTAPFADGLHELELTVADHSGKEATATLAFATDTVPPEVAITQPPPGTLFNDLSPEIRVTFADATSGVPPGAVTVAIDGVDVTGSCAFEAATALCDPPEQTEGPHTIRAAATDRAGNAAAAEVVVELVLDTEPPALAIVAPSEPLLFNDPTPELRATYADAIAGVDIGTLAITLDGANLTAACTVGPAQATCEPPELASGEHTVTAEVSDRAGNPAAASFAFELVFDTEPPEITLLEPADGSFLATATPEIRAEYGDAVSGVRVESILLLVDGADRTAEAAVSEAGLTFTPSPALAEGAHEVEVRVGDRAGNEGVAGLGFTIDTIAPQVAITGPAPGAFLAAEAVDVAGTLVDATPVSVVVNGVPAPVSGDGSFLAPQVPLPADGAVELTAEAIDAAGNVGTAFVTVVRDTLAPAITISGVADGQATNADVTPFVEVAEANPDTTTITLDGAPFASGSPVGAEGVHTLRVEALDLAGNAASAELTFTIDKTPPELVVLSPTDGELVGRTDVTVEGTVTDALVGVDRVEVNGLPAGIAGESWSLPLTLQGARATLEVVATDLVGNASAVTLEVILALPPLEIAITDPPSGFLSMEPTVVIAGTVAEEAGVVRINETEAAVAGGIFSAEVALREGRNTLTAVATNTEGRVGTATTFVMRDTTPPRVVIEVPEDGLRTQRREVIVVGAVNDITTGTINGEDVSVTCNGLPATVENRTFMVAELPLRLRGETEITCLATDRAGNESRSAPVTVIRQELVGQRIEEVSGNLQTGQVETELPEPLTVRLVDNLGLPAADRRVTFEVAKGSGTLKGGDEPQRSVTVRTDPLGLAVAPFTLGTRAGEANHRVRATAVGFAGAVEFCASAEPEVPDKVVALDGDNQRGVVERPLPHPFVVMTVDAAGNPLSDVPVTYEVVEGFGSFEGLLSVTVPTDGSGHAEAVLTLGPQEGINSNVVTASIPDVTGLAATFTASALVAGLPEQTSLTGLVLDNANQPVAGATVALVGTEIKTLSDDQGQFTLESVPVGTIHLEVDGSTASADRALPSLEFELVTIAGRENTLDRPVLLLELDEESSQVAGGDEDVTLEIEGVPGAELTIFANSVTCPDGSSECQITWTQVNGERVPMQPPLGSTFMLAWTLQPAGLRFDPPARVCIPNIDAPPGERVDIFSFDHDLGEFVSVGIASVTEDGTQVCSDPGFGVVKAGWGGCVPPPPPCTAVCHSTACATAALVGCNCVFTPINCDDGDACNGLETCDPLVGCRKGTPLQCDNGDPCDGVETCDPTSACQPGTQPPAGSACNTACILGGTCSPMGTCVAGTPVPCDDGNVCNGRETCDPLLGCRSGTPLSCDDGDPCNGIETCDPVNGCAQGTLLPDGTPCNTACTNMGLCQSGVCTSGQSLTCPDDGDVCNGPESCDLKKGCVSGPPLTCDDQNFCNGKETCHPTLGCIPGFPPSCDNSDPCDGIETCDPDLGCQPGQAPGNPFAAFDNMPVVVCANRPFHVNLSGKSPNRVPLRRLEWLASPQSSVSPSTDSIVGSLGTSQRLSSSVVPGCDPGDLRFSGRATSICGQEGAADARTRIGDIALPKLEAEVLCKVGDGGRKGGKIPVVAKYSSQSTICGDVTFETSFSVGSLQSVTTRLTFSSAPVEEKSFPISVVSDISSAIGSVPLTIETRLTRNATGQGCFDTSVESLVVSNNIEISVGPVRVAVDQDKLTFSFSIEDLDGNELSLGAGRLELNGVNLLEFALDGRGTPEIRDQQMELSLDDIRSKLADIGESLFSHATFKVVVVMNNEDCASDGRPQPELSTSFALELVDVAKSVIFECGCLSFLSTCQVCPLEGGVFYRLKQTGLLLQVIPDNPNSSSPMPQDVRLSRPLGP